MKRRLLRYVVPSAALFLVLVGALLFTARQCIHTREQPLPLRLPLADLHRERLDPYRVLEELKSPLIQLPVKEATYAGSSEYIHWVVQQPNETERRLSLFVTYYTGSLDRLYAQPSPSDISGVRIASQADESVTIITGGQETVIPLTVMEFEKPGEGGWILASFYYSKGRFCATRREVGQIARSFDEPDAYFSNVVIRMDVDSQTAKTQSVNSIRRFLEVLVPVLLEDHWPRTRTES